MLKFMIVLLLCSKTALAAGVKHKKVDIDRLKLNLEKLTSIGSRFLVDKNQEFIMKRPKARDEKIAFIEKIPLPKNKIKTPNVNQGTQNEIAPCIRETHNNAANNRAKINIFLFIW